MSKRRLEDIERFYCYDCRMFRNFKFEEKERFKDTSRVDYKYNCRVCKKEKKFYRIEK